ERRAVHGIAAGLPHLKSLAAADECDPVRDAGRSGQRLRQHDPAFGVPGELVRGGEDERREGLLFLRELVQLADARAKPLHIFHAACVDRLPVEPQRGERDDARKALIAQNVTEGRGYRDPPLAIDLVLHGAEEHRHPDWPPNAYPTDEPSPERPTP